MICIRVIGVAVMFILVSAAVTALAADEYLLGPEDVLSVSVWERPDLTRSVTVRAGGTVTFPPLGEVPAAGGTTAELARTLEDRLTEFLRRPTQVTVQVTEFLSQRVTVSGAVSAPGRYGFEQIPGLVEILGVAGGLGPQADLGRVQILRTQAGRRSTMSVDLAAAISTGNLETLPELQSNDVIFVSSVDAEVGISSTAAYVGGEVARPGPYSVGSGLDLFKLLTLSGGTTPTADISRVQVISRDSSGKSFVATIDLNRFIESGEMNFMIRPGDAVRVPSSETRPYRTAWLVAREVLGVSRDVLNLFLISDVLTN